MSGNRLCNSFVHVIRRCILARMIKIQNFLSSRNFILEIAKIFRELQSNARQSSNRACFTTKIPCKQFPGILNKNQFRKFSRGSNMKYQLEQCTEWDPSEIFDSSVDKNHAIVVLNRPISCDQNIIRNIWKTAKVTITVDGGTDRWLTFLGKEGHDVLNGKCAEYLPNLITGDMDSISKATQKRLESFGTIVHPTMDQNQTDYTKSLYELDLYCRERDIKLKTVYVLAETSGRLDQIIAGISTLYKSQNILKNISVIQISHDSLTWLLEPGMHKIEIPDILRNCKSWCGLLPVGYPVNNISTTGLKWNLDKRRLEMAGLVSTSNTYSDQPYVTISTDASILWTMGIQPIMKNGRK